ncbi:MAG TPA: hypothetical protein VI488_14750 [Candidatus Angelobacter sp.]
MKRSVLLALGAAAFFALGVAVAQQSNVPLGARIKMKWQGDAVRFAEGGQTHEVSIKEQFQAVRLDTVVLQSAKESNGFIYLLLDVTGPSKLPRDSHQCGGGNESNLIWLKLDKDWKVLDAKNFLYDSCWTSASMIDPPKWQGDTLKVTTVDKVATYSYKHPDEGLKVSEVAETK